MIKLSSLVNLQVLSEDDTRPMLRSVKKTGNFVSYIKTIGGIRLSDMEKNYFSHMELAPEKVKDFFAKWSWSFQEENKILVLKKILRNEQHSYIAWVSTGIGDFNEFSSQPFDDKEGNSQILSAFITDLGVGR